MPCNFHFARDLMTQFQSLTTAIVSYISTAGELRNGTRYTSHLYLPWKPLQIDNQMEMG